MRQEIHALSMRTLSPAEWAATPDGGASKSGAAGAGQG
jgi:hypothetical protein